MSVSSMKVDRKSGRGKWLRAWVLRGTHTEPRKVNNTQDW
jgi:hypothetical protein